MAYDTQFNRGESAIRGMSIHVWSKAIWPEKAKENRNSFQKAREHLLYVPVSDRNARDSLIHLKANSLNALKSLALTTLQ